jgi:hypothetical protein
VSRARIPGFDVEGPVQAEVFVLFDADGRPHLTGPCGAAAWYLEVGADEDPMAVVLAAVRRNVGEPLVVHSTSWRRDRDAVVLSFVAVIHTALVGEMAAAPVDRAELARGDAGTAPATIATAQVVEHGLRHLAWLVKDDQVVAGRLAGGWRAILTGYLPEPFRHLRTI